MPSAGAARKLLAPILRVGPGHSTFQPLVEARLFLRPTPVSSTSKYPHHGTGAIAKTPTGGALSLVSLRVVAQ
jgi:hypothetical protein